MENIWGKTMFDWEYDRFFFGSSEQFCQWIGLGENLQDNSIFNGKNCGFLKKIPETNPLILYGSVW